MRSFNFIATVTVPKTTLRLMAAASGPYWSQGMALASVVTAPPTIIQIALALNSHLL